MLRIRVRVGNRLIGLILHDPYGWWVVFFGERWGSYPDEETAREILADHWYWFCEGW